MPDTSLPYTLFEPPEPTTLLIRHYGIHRGLWALHVGSHSSGHNFVPTRKDTAYPAVLIGVRCIGLRRVETADSLTVDEAAVNPVR